MKKILLILIFSFLSNVVFSDNCDNIPKLKYAVNDFASIISEKDHDFIEKNSKLYFDKTTIFVVVVTINSLPEDESLEDYSLKVFNCNGIGLKNDAGVLLLISLNDRKIRIQTGLGVEGDLPDAKCKSIIEKMVPLFKHKKYSEGILLGYNKIINELGEYAFDQREQLRLIKEQEYKESKAKILDLATTIGLIILGIFFCFFCYFLIKKVLKIIEEKILKKEIEEKSKILIKKANDILIKIKNHKNKNNIFIPKWAKDEINVIKHKYINYISNDLNNQELTLSQIEALNKLIDKSYGNFIFEFDEIIDKIEFYKNSFNTELNYTIKLYNKTINNIDKFISDGYDFTNHKKIIEKKYNKCLDEITKIKQNNSNIDYKILFLKNRSIKSLIEKEFEECKNKIKKLNYINNNLKLFKDEHVNFSKENNKAEDKILEFEKKYPKNVWIKIKNNFKEYKEIDVLNECDKILNSIKDNNMNNINVVYGNFIILQQKLNEVKNTVKKLDDIDKQQENMKNNFLKDYNKVKNYLIKNQNDFDKDIPNNIQNGFKSLEKDLNEIIKKSKLKIVDWVSCEKELSLIYSSIGSLSIQALNYYNEKKRRKEQEERRKRDEQEEQERIRRDSYYNSNSSSSYSSTSGSGGGSGFGGGFSGGGGASGSW